VNSPVLIVRCRECQNKFRLRDYDGGDLPDCPVCQAPQENANNLDLSKPVRIAKGGSPQAIAAKLAQEVAERDYGLTDLRTKTDPGEMSAPKLTKEQQIMDNAWKQAGTFQAPQRFPGLAPGQGWMDAARQATAATGTASADAITRVTRGLRDSGSKIVAIDHNGRKLGAK